MSTMRWIRLVGLAVASGALASTAVLWQAFSPAGATSNAPPCLLPILCPPPTAPKAPSTTKAPPTTTATTAPSSTARTTATTAAARRPATTNRATPAASVGAPSVAAPALGPADLPALGTGSDAAAPLLAGASAPSTILGPSSPSPALSGLVGTTKGLPNDHSQARLVLSILVLLIAATAAAQLPASRRFPRSDDDALT